jgi:hypothetical protein
MSIDSISANTAAYTTATNNNNLPGGQLGQDFQSLAKALSSGDLTSAKTAFASIQTDIQNGPGGSASSSTSSSGSSSSSNPLQALASALKSGNLQDAQQAFAALQQSGKGHHHHHKGSGSASNGSSNSDTGSGSTNGIQSDFKALATALSSGSLTDAQTAFSTLQSDFKNNPPPDPSGMTGQNVDVVAT